MNIKKITTLITIFTLTCTLFSSCIGSFALTSKLHAWNREIDNQFVNELVFVAFIIVPVYPVSLLADALVINSIEFWSGENPVDDMSETRVIEGETGIYLVKTHTEGYTITKEGEQEVVELIFDPGENSWSIETDDLQQLLFKYKENGEVLMYLPDGKSMDVVPGPDGIRTFKQAIESYSYYAVR